MPNTHDLCSRSDVPNRRGKTKHGRGGTRAQQSFADDEVILGVKEENDRLFRFLFRMSLCQRRTAQMKTSKLKPGDELT